MGQKCGHNYERYKNITSFREEFSKEYSEMNMTTTSGTRMLR
jgi:hypothetical protein